MTSDDSGHGVSTAAASSPSTLIRGAGSIVAVPVCDDDLIVDALPVPVLSAGQGFTGSVPSAPHAIAGVAVSPPALAGAPAAMAPAAPESAEEEPPDDDDRFASRSLIHGVAAGGTSTVVHCILLVVLGLLFVPQPARRVVQTIQAAVEKERPLEQVVQRLQADLKPSTQVNMASSAPRAGGGIQGLQTAAAAVPPKLNTTVSERYTSLKVDVGAVNVFTTAGTSLAAAVPNGTLGEALTAVDGYAEAMDVLTREILNRLARNKVLVVWMFDQSLSMKDDQREIRDRIEKVYVELGLSSAVKNDALWTGVVSYGKNFTVHTQRPTSVLEQIRKAIDEVPVDESGEEMMCSAVGQTAAAFRQFGAAGGGRQLMLILVSDESGNQQDNQKTLEPAIAVCKDAKASVYVLGREAVFGYPYAHMNWPVTVPAIGGGSITRNFVVPVDRGPQTTFVELLQTEGFDRRTDAHPSGFGPYEQVRLARETGGMFLMLPTVETQLFRRDATQFSFEALRPYLPAVRSRDDYAYERDRSKLQSLIWKVINDLNPYKPEIGRYINLRLQFAPDAAERNRQIDAELAKAKQYVLYLDAAEKALREAAPFRNREKSPRWRAHYDLTLAQLVAYKARVYEYGAYLTQFKATPKPFDPPTANRALGRWDVRERGKTVADAVSKPLVDESTKMFKLVIETYLDTPWATRAQYELSRGFGIDLVPIYFNPNPPPGRQPSRPIRQPKI